MNTLLIDREPKMDFIHVVDADDKDHEKFVSAVLGHAPIRFQETDVPIIPKDVAALLHSHHYLDCVSTEDGSQHFLIPPRDIFVLAQELS